MNQTDSQRLMRIETRLVQLMTYLQCSVSGKNDPGGFFTNLKGAADVNTISDQTNRGDSPDAASSPRWSDLDRPAYLRRGRNSTERTSSALTKQAGKPAA